MKKVLALLFLFIALNSFATENSKKKSAILKGTIVNYNDKEPLTGVKIEVKETGNIIYTSMDGAFQIQDLPTGEYSLIIHHPSYSDKLVTGVVNTSDPKLEIRLFPN